MKIMTGKTGTPHVTSQQFRQLVDGTVGQESYILTSGENLEPELQTNNLLKIRSGMMSHHGNLSVVDIGTYDEVTIANGTQGMQRIDLVVNRYTRDESSGIESNTWVVIQGTPNASNPVAPAYTEGNLQEGDLVDDCPVFEVHLNGINVTEVVKLLDVVPNISELNGKITTPTSLLSRDVTSADRGKRVALTGNLSDFSEIEVRYTFNNYGHFVQSMRMPVLLLSGWSTSKNFLNGLFNPYGNGDLIAFKFDDSGITIDANESSSGNWKIKGIYGWR